MQNKKTSSETAKIALDKLFKQKYESLPKIHWYIKIWNWFFK